MLNRKNTMNLLRYQNKVSTNLFTFAKQIKKTNPTHVIINTYLIRLIYILLIYTTNIDFDTLSIL